MQSEEDAAEARKERLEAPETCAEVMAGMRERHYGEAPESKSKRAVRVVGRPRAGDPRLIVREAIILDIGWEAKVALYTDPDPVNHSGIKAKVPGGPNHLYDGIYEPVETEPEQILEAPSWRRLLEEEEATKLAHKASLDMSEVMKYEEKLRKGYRKGKRSKRDEEALKRVRKRADLASADGSL
jgi:hypothetical protein